MTNAIINSDNAMQAMLNRIEANDAKAQQAKINAEESARAARLARIVATSINTNCICTVESIENSYSTCKCNENIYFN